MQKLIQQTSKFLLDKMGDIKPKMAIVLGSGFGDVLKNVDIKIRIPYGEIPNFLTTSVVGHKGEFIVGSLNGIDIIVLSGRVHYYEGYPMKNIVFPIYVMKEIGVEKILLTNAVGAINPEFNVCDMVMVNDHINFTGYNPLIGQPYNYTGQMFPSLFNLYSSRINDIFVSTAKKMNLPMRQGVLLQTSGPSYETPAEVRLFGMWGADIVGMSSVIEAICAKHCEMEVACMSLVTNLACGINNSNPNTDEVVENANISIDNISKILYQTIKQI